MKFMPQLMDLEMRTVPSAPMPGPSAPGAPVTVGAPGGPTTPPSPGAPSSPTPSGTTTTGTTQTEVANAFIAWMVELGQMTNEELLASARSWIDTHLGAPVPPPAPGAPSQTIGDIIGIGIDGLPTNPLIVIELPYWED